MSPPMSMVPASAALGLPFMRYLPCLPSSFSGAPPGLRAGQVR
jgi:hypothetical protein